MKPKDIFGIVFRCVALWITVWGAWQLTAGIAWAPAILQTLFSTHATNVNSVIYLVYGLPAFVGGLVALYFADAFVGMTYRKSE